MGGYRMIDDRATVDMFTIYLGEGRVTILKGVSTKDYDIVKTYTAHELLAELLKHNKGKWMRK
jgi:hypothetical protein